MKKLNHFIKFIIFAAIILIPPANKSEMKNELSSINLKKNHPLVHQERWIRRSTNMHSPYENYFFYYSSINYFKHLNNVLSANYAIPFIDNIYDEKINLLWGTFSFFSLNYKIPVTKNIILWWQGYIPGFSGNENKFGLTYSNKFNFILSEENKTFKTQ